MDKPEPCLPAQRQENESRKRIPVRKGTEEHRGSPFARQPLHREDVFVFAVYTGLSFVDISNLTNVNINVGIDKSLWLNYYRQKTDIHAMLPLLQPAVCILKRYEAYHEGKRTNHVFPVPPNQVANRYLKKVAKEAGVEKNITFHMARHTFATTITLSHGIPIETVSKMLGHTSIKTTQIYAKILDTKVMDDMAALKELYTRKETQKSPNNKAVNE